jgi:hypothetical protein
VPEQGLYITFFDPGESPGRALPPFGPLIGVVVRPKELVAERKSSEIPSDPELSIARWLEAQLEYHRATGEESGGRKRSKMRLSATDGVFLRFAGTGAPGQGQALSEIGPYAAVVVGEDDVQADGIVIALRKPNDHAMWELTPAAGPTLAGERKADIGFRSRTTSYNPAVQTAPKSPPARPTAQPVVASPTVAGPTRGVVSPSAEVEQARIARERAAETLDRERIEKARLEKARLDQERLERERIEQDQVENDRIGRELREHARIERARAEEVVRMRREEDLRRPQRAEVAPQATPLISRAAARPTQAASAASAIEYAPDPLWWRLRYFLGGLLLLSLVMYVLILVRGGFSLPGSVVSVRTVGVGETIHGPRWDYTLNSVSRTTVLGTSSPTGVYVVVRLAVINKGAEGSEPLPSGFQIVDSAGRRYSAESERGAVYASQSTFIWPATFPAGQVVALPLVFDVDPAAQGLELAIADAPQARIRVR